MQRDGGGGRSPSADQTQSDDGEVGTERGTGPTRRAVLAGATALVAGCSASPLDGDAETPGTAAGSATGTDEGGRTATTSEGTAAPDGIRERGDPYVAVYEETIPSVAFVRVSTARGQSQGSGWVYDGGYVVTNAHVVSEANTVTVEFRQGDWSRAEVVGSDARSDLAVLSVDSAPAYAEPLSLADEPPVGTEVMALGAPFSLSGSASVGIVSGLDRSIRIRNGFLVADGIQTDAAVNPGNSGGPLVNLDGNVVGVVNSGGGDNVAFAVSASVVEDVVPSLVENGRYRAPYIGVQVRSVTPAVASVYGFEEARGVLVAGVVSGSPADGVLRGATGRETKFGETVPTGGDVVRAIGGTRIETEDDLSSYLAAEASPGETATFRVWRDGETVEEELTFGAAPER
ncbi:S1C family serine protease [Halopelagius longus]|uniref:PDZ domain-containing protein n=1 Tax=Halopelagius longus TaxID=1236180 RepID=A0A1H1AL62_9EURY|nr:trypsin-like peptidase domain-containing protein [Halopelagius longus]RDI70427.1 PDZ domain-containing protein [Halopelagius longus]SDQ40513.1 serine protease, S1-C subfamily, contains C-terminal PDZ domain [Halopelagius longus]